VLTIKITVMVELLIKNISEVDEALQDKVRRICEEKSEYYKELFKKYDKDLTIEVIFDHSSSVYKVSASLNLKSKKVLIADEGKDVEKVVTGLFADFKKAVKRQYELERKDYEYKRKR
jgi:predicted RNA-binding protein Jag